MRPRAAEGCLLSVALPFGSLAASLAGLGLGLGAPIQTASPLASSKECIYIITNMQNMQNMANNMLWCEKQYAKYTMNCALKIVQGSYSAYSSY